jgi:hypothetical protein
MAKASKRPIRVYPLINEIVEDIKTKRSAKVTFLDPRIVKVRWVDTDDTEELSRELFFDTNFRIAQRVYDV